MIAHPPVADTLASFTRRGLGLAVDSILVVVPVVIVAIVLSPDAIGVGGLALAVAVQFAIVVGYQTMLVARGGRTVGHRLCGVAVVRRRDGGAVSVGAAARRAVLPAAVALVPFVGAALVAIVYLRAAFHPLRQGLHDAVADTVVVTR